MDTEKLKKEAAAEAKAEILDALKGKDDKETKENTDEYEEWSKKIFLETGKQPNWKQASDFIKETVKRDLKTEQDAKEKEEADEKTKVEETRK